MITGKVIGCVVLLPDKQDVDRQKDLITAYCQRKRLPLIEHWIHLEALPYRQARTKRIQSFLRKLQKNDLMVVSELTHLGNSMGQIAILVDTLLKNKIWVCSIKEKLELEDRKDRYTLALIRMFDIFAHMERTLIRRRTREALRRARIKGTILGRPRGKLSKSKLDGKEDDIRFYLAKGVSKSSIAKILDVGWTTLDHYIKTRRIA